jgi:tricorn protease
LTPAIIPFAMRDLIRPALTTHLLILVSLSTPPLQAAKDADRLIFRAPTISQNQIAFEYANDLWIIERKGGQARRLTTGTGRESGPHFSPDGKQIAFTGEYEGNTDVYVVSADGGIPRRLTYHPTVDVAIGWTPDAKRVLFNSRRESFADSGQLYTIPVDGSADSVLPQVLPLPMAEDGSYSSDASHIAYQPIFHWQEAWKRYEGGQTLKIWLADLHDSSIVPIPRENSNDFNPMWIGNKVYFLSDRKGNVSLWSYDIRSRAVVEVVKNGGLDFKSAAATNDAIVYEQFGRIYILDLHSGKTRQVDIAIAADLAEVRSHFLKITDKMMLNSGLSPTGQRPVFEAHGEILTVPVEHGDIRNITASPGAADRDPAWSPDGKSIAYFSDESGEYALHIRAQDGLGNVTKINLGTPPSFFYTPVWAPDSKRIAYTDKRLNLWYVDLAKPTPVHVDADLYDSPTFDLRPQWSPDSKWLGYAKQLRNHLHANGFTPQLTRSVHR